MPNSKNAEEFKTISLRIEMKLFNEVKEYPVNLAEICRRALIVYAEEQRLLEDKWTILNKRLRAIEKRCDEICMKE